MKINITTAEEMQVIGALQDKIRKLRSLDRDYSSHINAAENVLEKIKQANFEEAQQIMRSEG